MANRRKTARWRGSRFPPSRTRRRMWVRKFRGGSHRSYFGRGLAAPSSLRSRTRPPHSPGRLSAVSIAANSGQTHSDSRLNPSPRILRLCFSNRSEFFDAIDIPSSTARNSTCCDVRQPPTPNIRIGEGAIPHGHLQRSLARKWHWRVCAGHRRRHSWCVDCDGGQTH